MTTGRSPAAGVDVWRAFAAGPEAWQDASGPRPELEGAVQLLQSTALLVAATWPVITLVVSGGPWDGRTIALLSALFTALAALVFLVPSAAVRRVSAGRPTAYLQLRVPLVGITAVAWAGLCVDAALLGLWPLGVSAGCDACRTGWALGLDVRPAQWLGRLLRSPVHVGVLAALGGFVVVQGAPTLSRVAWLYAAAAVIAVTATITAGALARAQRAADRRWAAREEAVVVREHRTRGHWLHDDVCADLRLLRLRLEDGQLAPERVLAELDELDHRLRLRQLDEFIGSGEVRLAEVVQPFLRRAQQLRVVVVESPTVEDAGVVVDSGTARVVQRALSVLVANALQAGSPTLAVRLDAGPERVVVEVEDEAGGFDLGRTPVGRGLDTLRHQLGEGALTCERTGKGSRLRAVVARYRAPGEPAGAPAPARGADDDETETEREPDRKEAC